MPVPKFKLNNNVQIPAIGKPSKPNGVSLFLEFNIRIGMLGRSQGRRTCCEQRLDFECLEGIVDRIASLVIVILSDC